jgi:polysaccharide pyruvyl transferase WcaK-like protein
VLVYTNSLGKNIERTTMSKYIGITAANFSGNKGAAAMLVTIIEHILKNHPGYKIKLFSVYPEEDRDQNTYSELEVVPCTPGQLLFGAFPLATLLKLIGLGKLVKGIRNRVIQNFSKCELVVDAAGINFVDSRGWIMSIYNFALTILPIWSGSSVIKFSQALGPFKKFPNSFLAPLALKQVSTICARGKTTYSHLTELGCKNIELCADGAFSMADDQQSKRYLADLQKKDDFFRSNRIVTISVSSVVQKNCRRIGIPYVEVLAEFCNSLITQGYKIFILANAARIKSTKPRNNDLLVGDGLYELIANKDEVRWFHEELDPRVIRELISVSQVLVGSRFHAMIGALERGVPVFQVGWSHKYNEVLEMFTLQSYAIDYRDLTNKNLLEGFSRVLAESTEIKTKLQSHISQVKTSSRRNLEIISDFLK